MRKLRIGFIGNFQVPYTTENDRKWSFEKLGHEVVPIQENEANAGKLDSMGYHKEFDLLLYSHTHGWEIRDLKTLFSNYKNYGIPTVSVHLDRWAGLARESDVGKEATWKTQYMFMADYSPEAQELYKKHNVNAFYLRPGVVERDCYMAAPDHIKFPHEIIFVGSKNYHSEYPFRPKLIQFLQDTYGDRFGHYGGDSKYGTIRGHDLNTLYATAKIAVGDSCFGGRPNYVSDRYYETRGRGGLLMHPHIEGVDHEGIVAYKHGDLDHLKFMLDSLLQGENQEMLRNIGFSHVKKHETYTNRAQEMLDIIFKDEI